MSLFDARNHAKNAGNRRLFAIYELIYTAVDFGAAMLFLVGSIMFFYPEVEIPATWCFVIGSALFAAKPTLCIVRELHYLAKGDLEDLADESGS